MHHFGGAHCDVKRVSVSWTSVFGELANVDALWGAGYRRSIGVSPFSVLLLDKQGRVAGDAIIESADGANIHLIGGFSTVLFNLWALVQRRTMICFANQKDASSIVHRRDG